MAGFSTPGPAISHGLAVLGPVIGLCLSGPKRGSQSPSDVTSLGGMQMDLAVSYSRLGTAL